MKYIGIIFGVLLLAVALSFLISFPIMLLWNWLMPAIFGWPVITWLEAWGLSLLSHLLIKSHVTSAK